MGIRGLFQGKKNFVFLGEAGCGKSELALNVAHRLAESEEKPVHFFDLDMTKPLFRSREQVSSLEEHGIQVHFEEQFMDAPTVTGGVREALRDPACYAILDVGGDYIGARAIGGYAPLLGRDDTAVYYVINPYRPWSGTLERIDKVLGETLGVSHVQLSRLRLVGNPNLGRATTAEDVIEGIRRLREQVEPYKPIDFVCVWDTLYGAVKDALDLPVFPLRLYLTYPWETET